MSRLIVFPALLLLPLALVGVPEAKQDAVISPYGETQRFVGEPPPATVPLLSPESFTQDLDETPTLEPSMLEATLMAGQSISEDKLLRLPGGATPGMGDVLICMDLTGSMGGELNNVKVNTLNIINAVRAILPDTQFGVVTHMDYGGSFSGCGYAAQYGFDIFGDYPYMLDQPITADINLVEAAIAGLQLGYGGDGPESYSRVLYEAYADPQIGWRPGARRMILQWGDSVPHDCNYLACLGRYASTGPDPGRDGVVGTADDLEILEVLDGLAANDIVLLSLHSGWDVEIWECYAQRTGGRAFQINADGTIPGGIDIADFIAGIIGDELAHIDVLDLRVCTPGFEDWLTELVPEAYTDIALDDPVELAFDITFTVPEGTPAGTYCFDVCAVGDGALYADQHVCITVPMAGIGACCFNNATCRILPSELCQRLRGTFMGDGTVCDPSPCVPKTTPDDEGMIRHGSWGRIKNQYR